MEAGEGSDHELGTQTEMLLLISAVLNYLPKRIFSSHSCFLQATRGNELSKMTRFRQVLYLNDYLVKQNSLVFSILQLPYKSSTV